MGLAVAVRISSEFNGRLPIFVSPYLPMRIRDSRHEPSVALSALSPRIEMDLALCFIAARLERVHVSFSSTVSRTCKIFHQINNSLGFIKNDHKVPAGRTDESPSGIDRETCFYVEQPVGNTGSEYLTAPTSAI